MAFAEGAKEPFCLKFCDAGSSLILLTITLNGLGFSAEFG